MRGLGNWLPFILVTMLDPTYTLAQMKADPQMARAVQSKLIQFGLLEPPADGIWGKYSEAGLSRAYVLVGGGKTTAQFLDSLLSRDSVQTLELGSDLASKITRWSLDRGWYLSRVPNTLNILYVEGMNPDGSVNQDDPDRFNDLRLLLDLSTPQPRIVYWARATIEPGTWWVNNPMNPLGTAYIAHGQYKAWAVGIHGNSEPHEALVQVAPVTVHRDRNKNQIRDKADKLYTGSFGINQHHGYDMARVGKASAGCAVGQSRKEHRRFMELVKQDSRHQLARSKGQTYIYYSGFIPGDIMMQTYP